jgi:hypothetical protein
MHESNHKCIHCLCGKARGKEITRKTRCRLKDNIKMALREIECDGMDCIDVAQDGEQWRALVNTVITFRVHKML